MTPQKPVAKREQLSSPLTWHYIGVAVLGLVVLGLAIRLGFDWAATSSSSSSALVNRQIELKTLEVQTAPLRGIEQRVLESRKQIQGFYAERIPANYSSIAVQVGDLAVKSGVHISGVQYTQGATTGNLTEISLDARISGEYQQIMHFVNGLERSHTFFVIRAMAFTGQQGGLVNLRLRVSTWLRPSDVPNGLPQTPAEAPANTLPASQEGE
ncbi:MAG TPA: GspMb/PilO family protein [Terracidiphilus sp.]|jgi:type IV pilus assembly protein PilO|nr:GspMb/PilO family protein [Terracidiphilus sp.]